MYVVTGPNQNELRFVSLDYSQSVDILVCHANDGDPVTPALVSPSKWVVRTSHGVYIIEYVEYDTWIR